MSSNSENVLFNDDLRVFLLTPLSVTLTKAKSLKTLRVLFLNLLSQQKLTLVSFEYEESTFLVSGSFSSSSNIFNNNSNFL
jgi:hypothetical protein